MPEDKTALLALSVTGDCNMRCRYCYACGGEQRTKMCWQKALKAIDVMAECFASFKVQFTGGEPLLNLDIIEKAIDYLGERGLKVPCQVQTNATLINSDVAGRLKSLKIGIGVSLDGPPPVNDTLRPFSDGRGSTVAALRGIAALRDEGIRVGATCVLSRYNVHVLPELIGMLSYLGNVEGIAIDFLRPVGRAEGSMQPDAVIAAGGIGAAIKHADSLAQLGGCHVRFREIERMRRTMEARRKRLHHCYFDACRSMVVMPTGDAFVCPSMLHPELKLGNIEEPDFTKGLIERMIRARRSVQDPKKCQTCRDRWLCGGPCLAHYISGLNLSIECAVKTVFMMHARESFCI
jgi:uncharacterized protein